MTSIRILGLGLLLALAPASFARQGTVEPTQAVDAARGESARFARVADAGVRLRNVPDSNGRMLVEVEKGSLVRVHGERSGWVKAEVPNGFPAWIHRKYVKETSEPDVVEIARNGVNVRALPSDGVNNFPVGQLYAGDRVRTLPTPPELAQEAADWVHVWSPPGFWAWVRKGDIAELGPGEKGELLWEEAIGGILPATTSSAPQEASSTLAKETSRSDGLRAALERAQAAFDRESKATSPNYAAVRSAYEAVLALDPEGTVHGIVQERLDRLALAEEMASLRNELVTRRDGEAARLGAENERIMKSIDDEARRRDPFRTRFDERGLLERRTVGDATRYFLRWGGKDVCEVLSTNGRYDLDVFLGLDIGVRGPVLPLPSGGAEDVVPILDVARIEILARG